MTRKPTADERDRRSVGEAGLFVLSPGIEGHRGIRQREWTVFGKKRDDLALAITRILNRIVREEAKRGKGKG